MGDKMKIIDSAERRARRLVDRLFEANAAQPGQICDWPVIGGHYLSGEDPTDAMRGLAVRALRAREWLAHNGPPDLPPLPLSVDEYEAMRSGRGLLHYIFGLFARSLIGRNYDVDEHPSFSDYVSGVLWEAERVNGDIGTLPNYPGELEELKKRFPPRELPGMSLGFGWEPPKQAARTLANYRRYRNRAAS